MTNKWVQGMASPNPAGRPRGGLAERRGRVTAALLRDAESVARAVHEAAVEDKDMSAAALILDRCVPRLKNVGERVVFNYDPTRSAEAQASAVIAEVASGRVTIEAGRQLIEMLACVVSFRDVDLFLSELRRFANARRVIPGGVVNANTLEAQS